MLYVIFFFFTATAPTEIYTLSLHDALPISGDTKLHKGIIANPNCTTAITLMALYPLHKAFEVKRRSEEHTSELQSHSDLVCRLLLEKKNKNIRDRCHRTCPCDSGTSGSLCE